MAKSTEEKARFIELRAQGKSYNDIAAELHISKSTCTAWERELSADIQQGRADRLNELAEMYGATKAARLERLGETLNRINAAIEEKDLSELPAYQLLQLKLQYEKALASESVEPQPDIEDTSAAGILHLKGQVYKRLSGHEISTKQAKIELEALTAIRAADEAARLDEMLFK